MGQSNVSSADRCLTTARLESMRSVAAVSPHDAEIKSEPMFLGCLLIVIGAPLAAANWYSPFSEAISGKHSSGVPPIGGLLIGAGAYWVSNSWWWALCGIPADFGLLFLLLGSPWIAREIYSRSRFSLICEMHAWRDGRRVVLKLYKDSGVQLLYGHAGALYSFSGSWAADEDGYQITISDQLGCRLSRDGDQFVAERTAPKEATKDATEPAPDLDGLRFDVQEKI